MKMYKLLVRSNISNKGYSVPACTNSILIVPSEVKKIFMSVFQASGCHVIILNNEGQKKLCWSTKDVKVLQQHSPLF